LAIGSFDVVHIGHQAIIKKLITIAKVNNLVPYILFFEPLPKEFFLKDKAPCRIYDFRNKGIHIHKLGIKHISCQKCYANCA
ncbi:bifunctional riboflavin kinase/FAD synthetase, partial [Francisella tularensis subsp. holarctica]|nr:bifunctional riboflavin kinase/FAD synthetase [Francisella tularensis subsp. holarctica]